MKVSKVIIEEKDLKKMMKKSGCPSFRKLAQRAGIDYNYLLNLQKGKHVMSEEKWEKIKSVL